MSTFQICNQIIGLCGHKYHFQNKVLFCIVLLWLHFKIVVHLSFSTYYQIWTSKASCKQPNQKPTFVHFDKWPIVNAIHIKCQKHHFCGGFLIEWIEGCVLCSCVSLFLLCSFNFASWVHLKLHFYLHTIILCWKILYGVD